MSALVVQWLAKGQHGRVADWAGDGSGVVRAYAEDRQGFGDTAPEFRGPAALVRFNVPLHLEAWVPVAELEGLIPVDELETINAQQRSKEKAS